MFSDLPDWKDKEIESLEAKIVSLESKPKIAVEALNFYAEADNLASIAVIRITALQSSVTTKKDGV